MNFKPFAVIDTYFFNPKTVRTVWDKKVVSIQELSKLHELFAWYFVEAWNQ